MSISKHILEHAIMGVGTSSGGDAVSAFVDYYTDLPDPGTVANKLYAVKYKSGNLWWSHKPGIYLSDGSTWTILDNATFEVLDNQATFYDNDNITKKAKFELGNISPDSTRTITLADRDLDLARPTFDSVQLDTTYSSALRNEGLLHWNTDDGTLEVDMPGDDVTLQIGQEILFRAKNDQGATITNGQAVYISGASGSKPEIKLANAGMQNAPHVIAVASEDILSNQLGYCTTYGMVRDIDTTYGGSAVAGDSVYLDTTDGNITTTELAHPYFRIKIGVILHAHATEGVLFVSIITSDDHSQYALLAGRSGGQTLIGGTEAGDILTLTNNSTDNNSVTIGADGKMTTNTLAFNAYTNSSVSGEYALDWRNGNTQVLEIVGATLLTFQNTFIGTVRLILTHGTIDQNVLFGTAGYWTHKSGVQTASVDLPAGTTKITIVEVTRSELGLHYWVRPYLENTTGITAEGHLTYVTAQSTGATAVTMTVATPNIDFALNDFFYCTMPTVNKTLTFSNPRTNMSAVIRVTHDSVDRNLVFPFAYWVGTTGAGAVTYTLPAGNTKQTHFYIHYDGSSYYISDAPYWSP